MKGEYVGSDGRTYRWESEADDGYALWYQSKDGERYFNCKCNGINPADWPAAKSALDALIAEEEEWVEIEPKSFSTRRFKPDGSMAEYWDVQANRWRPVAIDDGLFQCFRKGLEVKAEQVKALVEAIEDLSVEIPVETLDRIRDLAREVQP